MNPKKIKKFLNYVFGGITIGLYLLLVSEAYVDPARAATLIQEHLPESVGVLVGLVHVYALCLGWGWYKLYDNVARLPGGALFLAIPIIEGLVALLLKNNLDPWLALFAAVSAVFFFAGLLMLGIAWIFVIAGRGLWCFDKRLNDQTYPEKSLSVHGGYCGAFLMLRLVGMFPLMLPIIVARIMDIPADPRLAFLPLGLMFRLLSMRMFMPLVDMLMVLDKLQVRLVAHFLGRPSDQTICDI